MPFGPGRLVMCSRIPDVRSSLTMVRDSLSETKTNEQMIEDIHDHSTMSHRDKQELNRKPLNIVI